MREYREAVEQAGEKYDVMVGIFAGDTEHCDRLQQVFDVFKYLHVEHPTCPIEAFVVPIPPDDKSANAMKRAVIYSVEDAFGKFFPSNEDLN